MMIRASGEKKDEDGDGVDDMMAKVEWTPRWQERDRIRADARLSRCHPRWRDQRRVMLSPLLLHFDSPQVHMNVSMIPPMKRSSSSRFPPLRVWSVDRVHAFRASPSLAPSVRGPSLPPSLSRQVTAHKIVRILGILSDWMPAFVAASRHSRGERGETGSRGSNTDPGGGRRRRRREGFNICRLERRERRR